MCIKILKGNQGGDTEHLSDVLNDIAVDYESLHELLQTFFELGCI